MGPSPTSDQLVAWRTDQICTLRRPALIFIRGRPRNHISVWEFTVLIPSRFAAIAHSAAKIEGAGTGISFCVSSGPAVALRAVPRPYWHGFPWFQRRKRNLQVVVESAVRSEQIQLGQLASQARRRASGWTRIYLLQAAGADAACALAAGLLAFEARFGDGDYQSSAYFWLGLTLPVLWLVTLQLAGAYDARQIGVGTDEFRRVFNAGVCLTALVAVASYATRAEVARGYVVLALPCVTVFDMAVRFKLRKRLHRRRARGACMRRVVAVGHPDIIADLTAMLARDTYHGMSVVAACVVGSEASPSIDGIPAIAGLGNVTDVVWGYRADIVAVLACREMIGDRLRDLAWSLERTGTGLCVAPALLDVAGPRTTIRPTAGLPLLHLDHPEFGGVRALLKSAFDRVCALGALILLLPAFVAVAAAIRIDDGAPVFFRQTRVGKDGQRFTLYKFRTMVADAERLKVALVALNDGDGVLFKLREDPRVTRVGRLLRRYSLDELPQFVNVLRGDMSLVGPRPALPEETMEYGHHMRLRLAVKPGITGLWQINGRSNLPWDEAVRLDVRYVENWSFMLDLQILWKTWSAVAHGDGAY